MDIFCNVYRGSEVESVHQVYAVAVDSNGDILLSSGDPQYKTCIRSSLKPFQASVCVESGAADEFGFDEEELAVMCASHNGEEIHTSTVSRMLKKIGIDSSYYQCGSHPPYDKNTRQSLLKEKVKLSPLHNNCSGKHAGMLATAKRLGHDLKDYIHVQHPIQQKILSTLKEITGESDFILTTDGCSAPTPFMSLYQIAVMFQKLASENYPILSRLYSAMVSYPYLVAGRKRFDTDFMQVMSGRAVTKVGAEAVRGVGIRQKNGNPIGIAVKVLDGSQRANPSGTIAFLKEMGLLEDNELSKLSSYETVELFNYRKIMVGKISGSIQR